MLDLDCLEELDRALHDAPLRAPEPVTAPARVVDMADASRCPHLAGMAAK